MKIITIIGARPQFIKVAPVSRALERAGIDEILVHTGQHYDYQMSEVFFKELNLGAPKYRLNLGGGSHGMMTGRMLEAIEKILIDEVSDMVLVYGDTNSTLAGALAAAKLHIPVVHVEAGLRSFNRQMPEEINRIVTDHLSEFLFCSSSSGVSQLMKEGITKNVFNVGDVMNDAAVLARKLTAARGLDYLPELARHLVGKDFVLLTLHRQENTDDVAKLREIFTTLNDLGMPVLLPIHPRLQKVVKEFDIELGDEIFTIEPLGYLEMTALLCASKFVVTDSGGLQKEAYWAGKFCMTLRNETEWVETVDAGWNILIRNQLARLLDWKGILNELPPRPDLYGSGDSAEKIVSALLSLSKLNH